MARGDQIYVMRDLVTIPGLYEHHGIDCGDGTVIHYRKSDEAQITRTPLSHFTRGKPVFVKAQPTAFVPDVVVQRAESRLGERRYDLLNNNCEHFANWCKTGRHESEQLAGFGLLLDRFQRPELEHFIERTARDRAPESAMALFHQALSDIAAAHESLKQQYQRAQQDIDTWHRVAQAALARDREDLARAALQRKVKAQRQQEDLTRQLAALVEVQLTLERSRQQAENRREIAQAP